jgi:YHS domain-containing protein
MLRFLAELIVFTIAVSVIRSVIGFVQRAFTGARTTPGVRGRARAPGTAATMLQQDPVCGTYVAVDSSLKRVVNGRVLHFCSPECRDKYNS